MSSHDLLLGKKEYIRKKCIKWIHRIFDRKPGINYMVVSVGQACNFRCKNCGALAPYAPKEILRYDIHDIIDDLELLLSKVSFIAKIQIQGGEPFLHNELIPLIDYMGKTDRISFVEFATNGSIIPSDELLEHMCRHYVGVRISDYGIASDKAEKLQEKCQEHGVKSRIYRFTSKQSLWYEKGLNVERDSDDKRVEARFVNCKNNNCLTLERSELSYCSRACNAYIIQNFERQPSDYLSLKDPAFDSKLSEFLKHRHVLEACRYCYGTDESRLCEPAEQIIGDINR